MLKRWTPDEDTKAIEMLKNRVSLQEIAVELGRSRGSVAYRNSVVWRINIRKNIPNLMPSENLCYVLGVLKGDGSVSYSNRAWSIQLGVEDLPFAESFFTALYNINLKPAGIKIYGGYYYVYIRSKDFCEWYNKLTYSNIWNLFETEIDSKGAIAFLRGFYESEGNLYFTKNNSASIRITNTDFVLLEFVKDVISFLGYEVSLHKRSGDFYASQKWKDIYDLNILGTKEEKQMFLYLLNPCIKEWNGG